MDALACFSHFTHRSAHNEIKHAARVLSRYRDARRTRILRIRLRLTVRVKNRGCRIILQQPRFYDFENVMDQHYQSGKNLRISLYLKITLYISVL